MQLSAKKISNFTQRELNEGEPVTEKTEVAIVYSKNELHIGIWCYDNEPEKIVAKEMSRDFNWDVDDNFEIIISPFNDNRNGYLFVTNPNGALADVWVGDEGKDFNKDWNGVWDVAVERNDQGWSRLYELERISLAGRLTGLEDIEQKTKIELLPFVSL